MILLKVIPVCQFEYIYEIFILDSYVIKTKRISSRIKK